MKNQIIKLFILICFVSFPISYAQALNMVHLEDMEDQALVLQKENGDIISQSELQSLIRELKLYIEELEMDAEQIPKGHMELFFKDKGYIMVTVEDDNPDYLNPENYDVGTYIIVAITGGVLIVVGVTVAILASGVLTTVAVVVAIIGLAGTVWSLGHAGLVQEQYNYYGGELQDAITELTNQAMALAP